MKRTLAIVLAVVLALCLVLLLAGCAATDGGNAITEKLATVALDAVATVVLAVLGIVGTWVGAKTAQNKHLSSLSASMGTVTWLAKQTVGELQQTIVDALKEKQNGKLTDLQIDNLKTMLFNTVKKKMSDPVVDLLEAANVDVKALIQGAAEDWIGCMRGVEEASGTG